MQGCYKNVLLLCELEACFDIASVPRRGAGMGREGREDKTLALRHPLEFCAVINGSPGVSVTRQVNPNALKEPQAQILLTDKGSLSAALFKHKCRACTRRRCAVAGEEARQQPGLLCQIVSTQASRSDPSPHPLFDFSRDFAFPPR